MKPTATRIDDLSRRKTSKALQTNRPLAIDSAPHQQDKGFSTITVKLLKVLKYFSVRPLSCSK